MNLENYALLNPMTAWGSLFERLFEVVDYGGQHKFAELAVPRARVDSGAEPTLDGRKGSLGHPTLIVQLAVQPSVVSVIVGSEQPMAQQRPDAL